MSPEDFEVRLPTDLTGRKIGAYVLIRRLGRGGMAEVYLAEQPSLKRHVAIKILKPELAKDQSFVRRFHHEAQAAAALVQSNIVQIYEVGEDEGIHFIAQEYVRGQNLKQYLNRNGAVEPIVAVNIIRQVAAALQKAAEHDVIHRDIKPENIMLAPNGEVKVTDFGLARINNTAQKSDLTQIGITMGTPLYMSPEQVEGEKVDPRSDIYSLGITAYHMLAGQPPFDGENPLAIAVQHVKDKPPDLSIIRPDVPQELCRIIDKMMAKRPGDRYQTPVDLQRDVRKIDIDFDQWDQLVEKLAVETRVADGTPTQVSESRYAVTRQLETIMSGQVGSFWTSRSTLTYAGILFLAGLAIGVTLAWNNPPGNPLDVNWSAIVPRQESAQEQYRFAYWHFDKFGESAWKAVRDYFGPQIESDPTVQEKKDLVHVRKADERLAEYFLQENQFEKALDVYNELAKVESTEIRFQTVGKAGQAIVYDKFGNENEVRELLFQIEKNVNLLNPFLGTQVSQLLEKYKSS